MDVACLSRALGLDFRSIISDRLVHNVVHLPICPKAADVEVEVKWLPFFLNAGMASAPVGKRSFYHQKFGMSSLCSPAATWQRVLCVVQAQDVPD